MAVLQLCNFTFLDSFTHNFLVDCAAGLNKLIRPDAIAPVQDHVPWQHLKGMNYRGVPRPISFHKIHMNLITIIINCNRLNVQTQYLHVGIHVFVHGTVW